MDQEAALDRVEFPFEDYWRLYTTLDRLYAAYAKRYGESANSLYVLDVLYRHRQGISQADICADLGLPKQTVGSIMVRFQQRGLVDLATSTTDGRVKLCVLTESGWAYCEPIMQELEAVELRCSAKLGGDRLNQVREILSDYAALLEGELATLP